MRTCGPNGAKEPRLSLPAEARRTKEGVSGSEAYVHMERKKDMTRACLNPSPPVSPCRLLGLQKSVISNRELTTRIQNLSFQRIVNPGTNKIKGLFFSAPSNCSYGQGATLFSVQTDYHIDIAKRAGLSISEGDVGIGDGSIPETGMRDLQDKGIMGFILNPVVIEESPSVTKDDVSMVEIDKGQEITLRVSSTNGRLLLADQEIKTENLREIGPETASILNSNHAIYGFLWAVQASSGLTGRMPFYVVDRFLASLARHVAPDFEILKFIIRDRQLDKSTLLVGEEEATHPSCLRWPQEMMLGAPDS